jgi:enoyl-CoA hydratase
MAHGKANAFDVALLHALAAEFDDAGQSDARAVVLTGTGGIFSAGVDLFQLQGGGRPYLEKFLPALGATFFKAYTFSKPLVAAINGHAIAGGCLLACAADYRLMAEGQGRIGVPELTVGVPFPPTAIEILRSSLPAGALGQLVYFGKTCMPDEALEAGLVDEAVPAAALLDRATERAARLARVPAASFAMTKRLLRAPGLKRLANSDQLDREVLEIWAKPETQDAIRAYIESTLK